MASNSGITMLEVLVEEPSMKAALEVLLPRIVGDLPVEIRAFAGKDNLLRKLPGALRGYGAWARGTGLGIVVLVDRDDDDCRQLKCRLQQSLPPDVPLTIFSAAHPDRHGQVLNRVACEELEAWLLGDVGALRAVYPRLPVSMADRRPFRDPDAIAGGTWEALERLLQGSGYHAGGLPKYSCAKAVAVYMNVEENRSVSFRHFRDGVRCLVGAS